jgi:hypothetical protein
MDYSPNKTLYSTLWYFNFVWQVGVRINQFPDWIHFFGLKEMGLRGLLITELEKFNSLNI